jgi:hypothetical protein
MASEMHQPSENVKEILSAYIDIRAILSAWIALNDPEKFYEIVEDGVMEFDDEEECQTWQAQQ